MKSRRPKSEQRREARDDLKSIREYLRKPLLQGEPFDYAVRAQQVQDAQRWNTLASGLRFRAPPDPEVWDLHTATAARFWAALEAAYPNGFWNSVEKLRAGDAVGLENTLSFLEADPMFFRTGYVKTWLIRAIKPPLLKPSDIRRLQGVVLSVVDRRDDRDFRAYCKLARKADGPELREQLAQRVDRGDFDIRRRARWVLEALAQQDRMNNSLEKQT